MSLVVTAVLLLAGAEPAQPVSVGPQRQLLLDDFLIERMENARRRVCPVEKHPANPVIRRESDDEPERYLLFGSVIYDREEGVYKAWCDGRGGAYYFTSRDGVHWDKPALGLFTAFDGRPTNRVTLFGNEMFKRGDESKWQAYLQGAPREQKVEKAWRMAAELFGVTKDPRDPDPARRYKMGFLYLDHHYKGPHGAPFHPGQQRGLGAAFSPDGIHWRPASAEPVTYATCDGQTHWFYDERTGRYVLCGRTKHVAPEVLGKYGSDPAFKHHWGRAVTRAESPDFLHWTPDSGRLILSTDLEDAPTDEIYSLNVFPYEGLYIGLVQVFHNAPDRVDLQIQLAVSRDGVRFQRLSDRSPFIPTGGVGQWDRFNNSVANSPPIAVGDELRFYYSGRNDVHSTAYRQADDGRRAGFPSRGAVGLGTVRRDRFAAIEATFVPGKIRTRLLKLQGQRLHVNAAVPFGSLGVSLIDQAGKILEKTEIRQQDSTDLPVPLARLTSAPVRLEFALVNGQLYSFWAD